MSPPAFVTFTGIDDRTDMARVFDLSTRYPIEWGILFSPKRQGVDNRYPSRATIEAYQSVGDLLVLSAHLCGGYAVGIMNGYPPKLDLAGFTRSQVNHVAPDPRCIKAFGSDFKLDVIGQARGDEFPEDSSIAWLYDRSGGKGLLPVSWPPHPGERLLGYAGGIKPENAASVVAAIGIDDRMVSPYWIDMEGGIRTDDWLDLDKCEAVCAAIFKGE